MAEDSAVVTIHVVDHAPVAVDDHFYALEGEPVEIGAPGVLQNDSDPDDDPLTAELASSPSYGTLDYFDSDGSFRYTPNGGFTGTDSFTYFADDGYLQAMATVTLIIGANPEGISGDLDIIKFDGSELADDIEQSPGGFVVLNNDNDNYQFNGNVQVLDKDKAGPIDGEHDFVPLILHAIEPAKAGGKYRLVFASTNIKIWRTADKTGPILSDATEFEADQDTVVYVEGMVKSATGAAEKVRLIWVKENESKVLDVVNLTVYEIAGPMNLPGYAKYDYRAFVPGVGKGIWTATNGQVTSNPKSFLGTILWNSGPVVGKASYEPVPGLGFKGERNVNIVNIQLDINGAGNQINTPGTPRQRPNNPGIIDSAMAPAFAITASLTAAKIEGLLVNGAMRGVKFIEMGFVQYGSWDEKHADFGGPAKRRKSSLEHPGKFWLDTSSNQRNVKPWQRSTLPTGFFAPTSDELFLNRAFSTNDRPSQLATDIMTLVDGTPVTKYALIQNVRLSFVVRTRDSEGNNSDDVYTQRASQTWRFDGSGNVVAQVWASTGTGNTAGGPRFVELTDGTTIEYKPFLPFNKTMNEQEEEWGGPN